MEKFLKNIVGSVLLTASLFALLFILVGTIAFVINVVTLTSTTLFQKLSFVAVCATVMYIAWYCVSRK